MKYLRNPIFLAVLVCGCAQPPEIETTPYVVENFKVLWKGYSSPFPHRHISYIPEPVAYSRTKHVIESLAPLTIDEDGYIYCPVEGGIACLDILTGSVKWKQNISYGNDLQISIDERLLLVYSTTSLLPPVAVLTVIEKNSGRILVEGRASLSNAILRANRGRIFLFNRDRICSIDPFNLQTMWEFPPAAGWVSEVFLPQDIVLLNAHIKDYIVLVEIYSKQQGYQQTICLDFLKGNFVWSALGKVISIEQDRVYLLKEWDNEIFVRGASRGEFIESIVVDNFTGHFVGIADEEIVYTAYQKNFTPPVAVLSKDAKSIPDEFFRYELIRFEKGTYQTKWVLPLTVHPEQLLIKICADYLVIGDQIDQRGFVSRIMIYDLKSGKFLGQIIEETGIISWGARGDYVFYVTSVGRLVLLRII